jgi:hypothetical protein
MRSCHFLAHEDTGMMATLFIGPPDYVFRIEEHLPLILGLVAGMGLSAILFLLVSKICKKSRVEKAYEPVVMNELKSKAID